MAHVLLVQRIHFSPLGIHFLGILDAALSNVTLLASSITPELRRRYFGADDTWVPNAIYAENKPVFIFLLTWQKLDEQNR